MFTASIIVTIQMHDSDIGRIISVLGVEILNRERRKVEPNIAGFLQSEYDALFVVGNILKIKETSVRRNSRLGPFGRHGAG